MIEYIYKCDYEVNAGISHSETLYFHVEMCILGDKYDMQGLIALSVDKFKVSGLHSSASGGHLSPPMSQQRHSRLRREAERQRHILTLDRPVSRQ